MIETGTKVVILRDCRDGSPADGMTGIYEGDFDVECYGNDGEVEKFKNPRILLDNGSVIWGIECWWKPVDDEPLQVSRKYLDAFREFCRKIGYYEGKED